MIKSNETTTLAIRRFHMVISPLPQTKLSIINLGVALTFNSHCFKKVPSNYAVNSTQYYFWTWILASSLNLHGGMFDQDT